MTSEPESPHETSKEDFPSVPGFIYHFFRIVLGTIFIVASIEKLERPWDFGRAIYAYQLLTGPLAYLISPVAIIMPALEFVTGFFLIINRLVRPSALLILAMNIVFMVAIGSVMVRGMNIDCGCGLDTGFIAAIAGTQAGWGAMTRDIVILMMNIVVLSAGQSKNR
jgi:putative oxidoreductase